MRSRGDEKFEANPMPYGSIITFDACGQEIPRRIEPMSGHELPVASTRSRGKCAMTNVPRGRGEETRIGKLPMPPVRGFAEFLQVVEVRGWWRYVAQVK